MMKPKLIASAAAVVLGLSSVSAADASTGPVMTFGASTTWGYCINGTTGQGQDDPAGSKSSPGSYPSRLAGDHPGVGTVINAGDGNSSTDPFGYGVPPAYFLKGLGGGKGYEVNPRFQAALNKYHPAIVVLWIGSHDIAAGRAAGTMEAGYEQAIRQARAAGAKIIGATIQPSGMSGTHEAVRRAVNKWIRTSGAFNAVADIDAAVRSPSNPSVMRPWDFQGDYDGSHYTCKPNQVHPGSNGYWAISQAVYAAIAKL
jgi:lysophospholipase L1-like esterase